MLAIIQAAFVACIEQFRVLQFKRLNVANYSARYNGENVAPPNKALVSNGVLRYQVPDLNTSVIEV